MIWNLRNEVTMIVILSFPSFSSRPNNPKTVYVNIYGFPIILIKLHFSDSKIDFKDF